VTVEEKQRRLCLAILTFSLLMQLAAVGIDIRRSHSEPPDSSFEHQRPELSDWPTHGH